jgi:group II intron reverse transcriptase/maturase
MPETANDTLDKTRRLQRKLYLAAKRSQTRRFHALYDKVYRADVLERAWGQVKANHGGPGVDAETIDAIERQGIERFLGQLEEELRTGSYRPQPVRRVLIPKPDGRQRPLGIPAVRDRVVQAAVKLVIEPIFEADFRECSFGFRPKRSAHQARDRIRKGIQREQCRWVVDADIVGFFDHVDRRILMTLLRRRISDRRVLQLIQRWLEAGVLTGTTVVHPTDGTPQGAVLSPLLANVYLHVLDTVWESRHGRLGKLTRYADDLVILTWQRHQAVRIRDLLAQFLGKLKLELSPSKTRLVDLREAKAGFDFLGYHYRWVPVRGDRQRRYPACWPSRRAMAAARQRIRGLTPLERVGLPISQVVQEINRFLDGWGAYFRYGNSTQQFRHLDQYVTDRLCRFIARKHGRRGIDRGLAILLETKDRLGLHRLTGTVRYASANAGGERVRRAV